MYNQAEERKIPLLDRMDVPITGFIIGLLVPLVVYFVIYFTKYSHQDFSYFVEISQRKMTAPTLLRVMVFPNLPIFLVFNILKKFLICRGIFIASILIIGAMLLIKYL
jgi:hypothetical protein